MHSRPCRSVPFPAKLSLNRGPPAISFDVTADLSNQKQQGVHHWCFFGSYGRRSYAKGIAIHSLAGKDFSQLLSGSLRVAPLRYSIRQAARFSIENAIRYRSRVSYFVPSIFRPLLSVLKYNFTFHRKQYPSRISCRSPTVAISRVVNKTQRIGTQPPGGLP